MKTLFCWRCKFEVLMAEPQDARLVQEAMDNGMSVVERERVRRGIVPQPPLELSYMAERDRPMLEMHRLLSGFPETNPNALWHHRVFDHGLPCPRCNKPLRTNQARYCASCGYGIEEMKNDPRPLIVRRASEFRS